MAVVLALMGLDLLEPWKRIDENGDDDRDDDDDVTLEPAPPRLPASLASLASLEW